LHRHKGLIRYHETRALPIVALPLVQDRSRGPPIIPPPVIPGTGMGGKGHRTTNNEQRTTNNEQRTTNNEQRTTNNEQQTTNNKQQTTNNEQRTTNNEQQTTNNKQRTTNNATVVTTITALVDVAAVLASNRIATPSNSKKRHWRTLSLSLSLFQCRIVSK
jgi:hypothetical protein